MVNPLYHWLRVPFCTRSRIPLKGLYGSWEIGFHIPLRGLSGFRVPLGLVFLSTFPVDNISLVVLYMMWITFYSPVGGATDDSNTTNTSFRASM